MSETKIIAFAGKGGVGKTSLAALMVRLLTEVEPQARILAIDADPAVGLSTALGVEVTHTLDDIRQRFIGSVEGGDTRAAIEILNEAHYEIIMPTEGIFAEVLTGGEIAPGMSIQCMGV